MSGFNVPIYLATGVPIAEEEVMKPKCPTCGTDDWVTTTEDQFGFEGKCVNKHLICTDPATGRLYNCATGNVMAPTGHYRLSWEMVAPQLMHKYCNADPMMYKNVTQVVPNSQIPDEDWHRVENESSDPWDQYNTLKRWAEEGAEPIRNVKLERQISEPRWEEVSS